MNPCSLLLISAKYSPLSQHCKPDILSPYLQTCIRSINKLCTSDSDCLILCLFVLCNFAAFIFTYTDHFIYLITEVIHVHFKKV